MKFKRILKWTSLIVPASLFLWLFIAYWMSTNDCGRNAYLPALSEIEGDQVLRIRCA